jgi:hypothetical protein
MAANYRESSLRSQISREAASEKETVGEDILDFFREKTKDGP